MLVVGVGSIAQRDSGVIIKCVRIKDFRFPESCGLVLKLVLEANVKPSRQPSGKPSGTLTLVLMTNYIKHFLNFSASDP